MKLLEHMGEAKQVFSILSSRFEFMTFVSEGIYRNQYTSSSDGLELKEYIDLKFRFSSEGQGLIMIRLREERNYVVACATAIQGIIELGKLDARKRLQACSHIQDPFSCYYAIRDIHIVDR